MRGFETRMMSNIRGELKNVINAFLKALKKRDRDIFLCRYYFSYSTKDISDRFGLSEEYVRTVLSRIRAKLKDRLIKEGRL